MKGIDFSANHFGADCTIAAAVGVFIITLDYGRGDLNILCVFMKYPG
jgi:hypothetical protein